jgi:hypothetical protein
MKIIFSALSIRREQSTLPVESGKKEFPMKKVIRITRHAADDARIAFLQAVYGDDVQIITDDIPYGDDGVVAVIELIDRHHTDECPVVAVEAQAPFPVLMKLVDSRRDLGVSLIRAQFERGPNGRAIVTGKDEKGRDLLKFSHYEELLRIEFETKQLLPAQD